MKCKSCLIALAFAAAPVLAEENHGVYLQDQSGERLQIATLNTAPDGTYDVTMNAAAFTDHFLSMRPFKCLEGPVKNWCHMPYPYAIRRDISEELTDLEYDFLFLWKDSSDYGINMWNGIYYRIEPDGGGFRGAVHEMDMNLLASPPEAGDFRPLRPQDIIESDPDSHWLPHLIIE